MISNTSVKPFFKTRKNKIARHQTIEVFKSSVSIVSLRSVLCHAMVTIIVTLTHHAPTLMKPKAHWQSGHKHMCSGDPNTQPNVRSIHPEEVIRQVYTLFTGGKNLRKGATFACP